MERVEDLDDLKDLNGNIGNEIISGTENNIISPPYSNATFMSLFALGDPKKEEMLKKIISQITSGEFDKKAIEKIIRENEELEPVLSREELRQIISLAKKVSME
jgi:ketol-acid reductoisomerase